MEISARRGLTLRRESKKVPKMDSASPAKPRPALRGWPYLAGGLTVCLCLKHTGFSKFGVLLFDFLVLDLSPNVAIYIVRSDEADGWVHVT